MDIDWQCTPFRNLTPEDFYAAMQIRQRVFIIEQTCIYMDADGSDQHADHLLGWTSDGGSRRLVAYARLFPRGVKFEEASIGRVATHPDARGTGAGKELMREAVKRVEDAGWGTAVRIGAQMYLEAFYEGFGFKRVGDPYLEDDIWHVDMLRA